MDPEVSRNVNETPYSGLTPDVLQEGLAELGFLTDGRLLALNSYENRVYQVGIEDAEDIIADLDQALTQAVKG